MSENYTFHDQISSKEIVQFLLESWRMILVAGIIGLFVAIGFIISIPSQYEATAQIGMMRVNFGSKYNGTTPLGVVVEEVGLLIARLGLPSAYTTKDLKGCGIDQEKYPYELLASLAKLSKVKGVDDVVELKVRMQSKEQAINCAQSIFENIRESQNKILEPYIKEAQILLREYKLRLESAKLFIARSDKSTAAISATYLATYDEVRFLTDEVFRLNRFIVSVTTHQARLVTPINAIHVVTQPKKIMILLGGLFIGLFLGAIFKLSVKVWKRYLVLSA